MAGKGKNRRLRSYPDLFINRDSFEKAGVIFDDVNIETDSAIKKIL